MPTPLSPASHAEVDLALTDLGPLAWVVEELRKAVGNATRSLRRFVQEAEGLLPAEKNAADASQLRIARQQLHQAAGAMDMVGQAAPSGILRAMEAATQQCIQRPELCTEDAISRMEKAGFGLLQYVEALLQSKPVSVVSLFPQYRDVQALAGQGQAHPADLWPVQFRWIAAQASPSDGAPLHYEPSVHARFEHAVLKLIKVRDVAAARTLRDLAQGFSWAQASRQPLVFWQISAGFFEALALELIQHDIHVKRAVSRILQQYSALTRGEVAVPDRLGRDILFFCAQAVPSDVVDAPALRQVRRTFALTEASCIDYDNSPFGLFDPALLVQARKRIGGAKEAWSSVAGGDLSRMRGLADQFGLVADSLVKLHPASSALANSLAKAADSTARSGAAPSTALAMEVATSIMFLEAMYDELDPADTELAGRTTRLAQRIAMVQNGGEPQPLEVWIEELYRRVSDRQTMGSVVGELRNSLAELERLLDLYFRTPEDTKLLAAVPGQLAQMRGVMSVLGLDQAVRAIAHMRDVIEQLMVGKSPKANAVIFDKLGNNLGALGLLFDMLNYQPVLAKKLFTYDDLAGELKPMMGRVGGAQALVSDVQGEDLAQSAATAPLKSPPTASVPSPAPKRRVPEAFMPTDFSLPPQIAALAPSEPEEKSTLDVTFDDLATLSLTPSKPVKEELSALHEALHSGYAGLTKEQSVPDVLENTIAFNVSAVPVAPPTTQFKPAALIEKVAPVPIALIPVTSVTSVTPIQDDFEDDELLGIFLEEVSEVVETGLKAVALLSQSPADLDQQTTLRRAFHTLKGSSRMVGLNDFGEAAWSFEQLHNTWLADRKPASQDLCSVSSEALSCFGQWAQDISAKDTSRWSVRMFQAVADALRVDNRLQTIVAKVSAVTEVKPVHVQPVLALVPELVIATGATPEVVVPHVIEPTVFAPEPVTVSITSVSLPKLTAVEESVAQVEQVEPLAVFDLPLEVSLSVEPTLAPPVLLDSLSDVDFELMPEPVSEPAPLFGQVEQTPDTLDVSFADEPLDEVLDVPALITESNVVPIPRAVSSAVVSTVSKGIDAESGIRAIGSLRIGVPLYNVYIGEADEWSRKLQMELSDWSLERETRPLYDSTVSFAHSLAGSSATVGFTSLSGLARDLEHALQWTQLQGIGSEDEALVYNAASDEIRRLLHQFAAGFLKEPDEDILSALQQLHAEDKPEEGVALLSNEGVSPSDWLEFEEESLPLALPEQQRHQEQSTPADADLIFVDNQSAVLVVPVAQVGEPESTDDWFDDVFAVEPEPEPERPVVSVSAQMSEVDEVTALEVLPQVVSVQPPAIQPPFVHDFISIPPVSLTQAAEQDFGSDDELESFDVLDPDLSQIFEEEAAELIPLLGASLRQWVDQPDHWGARSEALRVLHTLKGSARLAGAMRLGERVHLMESAIEAVHSTDRGVTSQHLEPLLTRFDAVQSHLESLWQVPEPHTIMPQAALQQTTRVSPVNVPAAIVPAVIVPVATQVIETVETQSVEVEAVKSPWSVLNIPSDLALAMPPRAGRAKRVSVPADQLSTSSPPMMVPVMPSAQAAALVRDILSEPLLKVAPTAAVPLLPAAELPPAIVSSPVAPILPTSPLRPPVLASAVQATRASAKQTLRISSQLLDSLVNQTGEVMMTRSRLDVAVGQVRGSVVDLSGNLDRLRQQLRDIELQAELQMQSRMAQTKETERSFDPLEFDRFTRVQELTRMMAESVNDVATVQRNLQRALDSAETDLIAQARQTRELQRDLLRTRMVEFEAISERLYRVVRQASKDSGKQVKLDIVGGAIEMDRGVLDRMTPAFEHLLRNAVAHGIEDAAVREANGKPSAGDIVVHLRQEGNDVSIAFTDDGGGLQLDRIRAKASSLGLITMNQALSTNDVLNLIYTPGFSTASQVTELAGRGIGMDVVRSEVLALGGRIETSTDVGKGSKFNLILPLTTAVTQVVMVRVGRLIIGVPSNVVEVVRRVSAKELIQAYADESVQVVNEATAFYWAGALLQSSSASDEKILKTATVVVLRSAQQRVAMHVDEVLGNQEVVVKNLGPQMSRLPGLSGITMLPSGAVVLIYNPVALASVYGVAARELQRAAGSGAAVAKTKVQGPGTVSAGAGLPTQVLVQAEAVKIPLVLVVDDSITVRRVTQRLLAREGYRVALAADGLQAIERLMEEIPSVLLSDIEMPRMDGFELARKVRADAAWKDLPIITISSRTAEKHRDVAKGIGVNHYLGKPYGEEELLSLIRHYAKPDLTVA